MNIESKIMAMTKLMQDGVLTADELARVIKVLSNPDGTSDDVDEKTPLEKKYDECFEKHIINVFKSPSSCKWPRLTEDMIKEGNVSILDGWSYKSKNVRYIETYIDAPNSYGAMLRKKLRIVIDGEGEPQMVLDNVKGLLGGESENWMPLTGVSL